MPRASTLAAVLLCLSVPFGPALAADATAPVDWAGAYGGLSVAVGTSTVDLGRPVVFENNPDFAFADIEFDDGLAGASVVVGHRWQVGTSYWGIESDAGKVETRFVHNGMSNNLDDWADPEGQEATADARLETRGHVRLTYGRELAPRILAFVAGGAAFGSLSIDRLTARGAENGNTYIAFAADGTSVMPKTKAKGVSLGLGLEYALNDRIHLRGEAIMDRYDFGPLYPEVLTKNVQASQQSLRLTVLLRF